MGDLELSLDDIIKKKLVKTGINRGRNNANNARKPAGAIKRLSDQNNRNAKNLALTTNKSFVKARPGVLKSSRVTTPTAKVGDARLKIIQKQRQKITDAREKLGQIAKQTDARLRLMKMRERQRPVVPGRLQDPLRGILPEEHILQRTIRGPTFDDAYIARSFSERAVIDPDAYMYRTRQEPPLLYRTIENDLPHSRLGPEPNVFRWSRPGSTSPVIDDVTDIPISKLGLRTPQLLSINRNDNKRDFKLNSGNWESDEPQIVITKKLKPVECVGILKRTQPTTVLHEREAVRIIKESPPPGLKPKGPVKTLSERFCQDGNPSAQKISQLKARLEASQQLNNKNAKGASVGHRIIVSNLVPSVTHEDVKELFEDIGELLSSKVIRPGTAEVVYKLHKDAVKAVDVYHNRQLDGQPMKCLLMVNNKPVNPLTKATKKTGKPIVELDMTAFRKALHKKSTS